MALCCGACSFSNSSMPVQSLVWGVVFRVKVNGAEFRIIP